MNRFYVSVMTRAAQSLAACVLLIVSAVLVGYVFHLPILVTLAPALQGMSVLSATGVGCIAVAFFSRGVGFGAASIAVLVAVAVLICQALNGQDTLSPALAYKLFGMPPALSGRTSVATAIGIALLGLAQHQRLRGAYLLTDMLASAVLVLSGTALLGYLYGVRDLYALYLFNTMAVHTAAALFGLGLATHFAQAEHGWARMIASSRPGGGATRRQLAFTLVPPLAGAALLEVARIGELGPAVAMALLVVITIVPLIALILRDGQVLDTLDIVQESANKLQQHTAEHLSARLAEQAVALNHESAERARIEAAAYGAQRLEAVGQLTGGIAHDFNNLLMAIGSNLHLIQNRLQSNDPLRTYVDSAADATQRGARVAGQLLAFSRTQRLDIRAIELDSLVRGTREVLSHALGAAIVIDFQLRAPGAWIRADGDQLQLALLNLALNARDAMPIGGTVGIHTSMDELFEPTRDDQGFAMVRMKDTGVGMTPEVIDRAIEPFFTTKQRGKGTGLGLSQVYGVVKQCGGELRITSMPGGGTTIDLLMPLTAPPQSEAEETPRSASNHAETMCAGPLLVIDDDDHVRVALAEMFRSAGYEVREAENGTVALRTLDEIRPALAVIDFIMPGLNGAEVARLARKRLPALPIIFVSGYADTLALDEIHNAVVLRKPVGPDTLFNAVDRALRAA